MHSHRVCRGLHDGEFQEVVPPKGISPGGNNAKKRQAQQQVINIDPNTHPDKKAKYTVRYDPERAMTKEEVSEWRKQKRKERNRTSAAASREKVREKIKELEDKVEDLRTKYVIALKKIKQMESSQIVKFATAVNELPPISPLAIPETSSQKNSPISEESEEQTQIKAKPHVIETNSRAA